MPRKKAEPEEISVSVPSKSDTPHNDSHQKCDPNLLLLLEELHISKAQERMAFEKEVESAKEELKRTLTRNWITYILCAVGVVILAILNFAPFQEMIISKIDERYVDASIKKQLSDVEMRLAKVDSLSHMLTMKTQAILGNIEAYNELVSLSKEDDTARLFVADVESAFVANISDFSIHYTMRDLHLKRRKIDKGYDELVGMLSDVSTDNNERVNIIKNLPDAGADDKACAEKLIEIVISPKTMQERGAAIQGLIYLSTKNDTIFSKELMPTMSVDEVMAWWQSVATNKKSNSGNALNRGTRILSISPRH